MTADVASRLAIIPARGGSKAVPRKNVRPLCGKPLIAWTIEAARDAETVSRVVVSTDDAEIGAVAEQFGAEVAWRPAEISGDRASSEAALLDVLTQLEARERYSPTEIVFLQCTSPLTIAEDIDATVRRRLEEEADTVFAASDFHYFLWQRDAQGDAVGVNHDKRVRLMRQEREPNYRETGAVYVMDGAGFRRAKHRFFGRTAIHRMPAERCLEIDEPVDFLMAEVLLRERLAGQRRSLLPERVAAVVFDFDGVFTDNRVFVFQDGREAVACDRGDGWGLSRLREAGVRVLVLSTETNPVVEARCRKLAIPCLTGHREKLAPLRKWLSEEGLNGEDVVYVGNDENDRPCLEHVGCGVVVGDAHPSVRASAKIVLENRGGSGAVREICDLILGRLG